MEENKFYDGGWNAFIDDRPYDPSASQDWRDGWKDCEDAMEDGILPEKI